MTSQKHVRFGFAVLLWAGLVMAGARAAEIEPPNVQLVDKFGVNMANGQVTHSMSLVSIGGALGLSDSISVRANEFDFIGYRGFNHMCREPPIARFDDGVIA